MGIILFIFFNFFIQYFIIFSVQIFYLLVKFISKYFIHFDDINGNVFLISFSDSLLLVYRNMTDFCMLTLYSETLLNSSFTLTVFFGGVFKGFHIQDNVTYRDNLLLLF